MTQGTITMRYCRHHIMLEQLPHDWEQIYKRFSTNTQLSYIIRVSVVVAIRYAYPLNWCHSMHSKSSRQSPMRKILKLSSRWAKFLWLLCRHWFDLFSQDKDVSKFNLALQQAIDTIRTHDIVIQVSYRVLSKSLRWWRLFQRSTDDIIQWLENWGKKSKI